MESHAVVTLYESHSQLLWNEEIVVGQSSIVPLLDSLNVLCVRCVSTLWWIIWKGQKIG